MAVSFKIPASPKRSIFTIDTFMGVDLTNSGSNIDDFRSPNAENMIRYVPGKVRKRMGYDVPVEISEGADVNRLLDTSDEWIDLPTDGTETIYELAIDSDPLNRPYWCVDIQAVGTIEFGIIAADSTRRTNTITRTADNPFDDFYMSYGGRDYSSGGGVAKFFFKVNSSDPEDYLRIKNLRLYRKTNLGHDDFSAGIWKSAPEDKGYKFVLASSSSPVYGYHTLKVGDREGDFVTNVNRALRTTDTFRTFSDKIAATLGETIPIGKSFYISFDYENASSTIVYLGRDDVRQAITTINGTGTYHAQVTASANGGHIALSDTTTGIKNLIVCYNANDSIEWSPAPEDDNKVFPIDDVYQGTGITTQVSSIYTSTTTPSAGAGPYIPIWFRLQNNTTSAYGKLTKIDFDVELLTITEHATGGDIDVQITKFVLDAEATNAADTSRTRYRDIIWIDADPNNRHFTLYLKPTSGNYFIGLLAYAYIGRTLSYGATVELKLNNLTVEEMTERSDFWNSKYVELIHVGRELYSHKSGTNNYTVAYNSMNQARSMSWQFESQSNANDEATSHKSLFISDGKTFLEYNSQADIVKPVYGNGKVPVVTIAKTPRGGGTSFYPLNRLQPGFEEQFIGTGTDKEYYMSFQNLDENRPRVWIKNQSTGAWEEKVYSTDFSVNYKTGKITFVTAPWNATSTGEDNVRIRCYRTVARYVNSINKCSFGTRFGVGGASNRLFLAGNTDTPNYDYFSAESDPTYFPDTYYSVLGVSASASKGYARVNNYLATFKDENEPSQSVFIREGDTTVDSNNIVSPVFKLINTLQGNGALSPYTFGYLQTEPLFLTKSGVYAITAQDITGEKYGQSRSFYLNGFLTEEPNMDCAYAVVYNDQYILSLNNKLYILDGLQATRTDRAEPYATRQYVGFYCTGIPASVMWTYQDALWFGTTNGKICKFFTDVDSLDSYSDDGEAIYCCWETPDLDGKLFYKNKTFRYFAVRMMSALRTSIKMYSRKLGSWSKIKEDNQVGIIFDFEYIDFERFSFSTDRTEKVAHTKVRVKKVDKARFKVENDALNEPFGLFDLALEYVESGNFKG